MQFKHKRGIKCKCVASPALKWRGLGNLAPGDKISCSTPPREGKSTGVNAQSKYQIWNHFCPKEKCWMKTPNWARTSRWNFQRLFCSPYSTLRSKNQILLVKLEKQKPDSTWRSKNQTLPWNMKTKLDFEKEKKQTQKSQNHVMFCQRMLSSWRFL